MHRIFLSDFNNILVNCIEINSPADAAHTALQAIIASQGALRTRYNNEAQCFEEFGYCGGWEIPELDIRDYSCDLDMCVGIFAKSAYELDFLAENMLLSRLLLIKIDEEHCALLSAIHHSIWDGVSQDLMLILINDFMEKGPDALKNYSYAQYCTAVWNQQKARSAGVGIGIGSGDGGFDGGFDVSGGGSGNGLFGSEGDGLFSGDWDGYNNGDAYGDGDENFTTAEAVADTAEDAELFSEFSELAREASALNTLKNPAYRVDIRAALNDAQKDRFVGAPVDTAMALLVDLIYGSFRPRLSAIPFTTLRHNRNARNSGMLGMTLSVDFALFDIEAQRQKAGVSAKYPAADHFSPNESVTEISQNYENVLSSIPIINYLGIFGASGGAGGSLTQVSPDDPFVEIEYIESGDNDVYIEYFVQGNTLNACILGLDLEKGAIIDAINKI